MTQELDRICGIHPHGLMVLLIGPEAFGRLGKVAFGDNVFVVVRADLNEHLKAIRDYFLLAKSYFFQSFLEEIRQLMRLPPRQSMAKGGLMVPFRLIWDAVTGSNYAPSRVMMRLSILYEYRVTQTFRHVISGGSYELKFLAFDDMGKAPRDASIEHYIQISSRNVDSIFHISDTSYATGFLVEWDFFLHLLTLVASKVSYMTAIGNNESLVALHGKSNLEEETRQPPAEPPLMLISHLHSWICHRRSSSSQLQEI
ncbi:probable inactive purple acid phosphatase 27 [Tanacetum coccineum]